MRFIFAAYHARRRCYCAEAGTRNCPVHQNHHERMPAPELDRRWQQQMRGPVDPAHDPCGRPPLPAEETTP